MSFPRLAWWIDGRFLPEVSTFRSVVARRILPAFENIEDEAKEARAEALNRLSSGAGPDDDFASIAEIAFDSEITRYELLSATQQAMINLIAVAMYHQFEQHQITLVRRELIFDGTEDDESRMNTRTFVHVLGGEGIDVRTFPEWPKLTELRLVANVAKHAEGDSASKLEELRPDLFVAPAVRDMPPFTAWKIPRRVYKPLSGEDLYVTPSDLDAYFDAIIGFRQRLSSAVVPDR